MLQDVVLPPFRCFARAGYGIDPSPPRARLPTYVECDGDTIDKLSLRLALWVSRAVTLYTASIKRVLRFKPCGLYVPASHTLVLPSHICSTSVADTFVVFHDR